MNVIIDLDDPSNNLETQAIEKILKDLGYPITVYLVSHFNKHHIKQKLQQNKIDLIIFLFSSHPNEIVGFDEFWKEIDSLQKKSLVLTTYPINQINSIFCPTWALLYNSAFVSVTMPSIEQVVNSKRTYTFSCLNNRIFVDRLVNLTVWEKYLGLTNPDHLITCVAKENLGAEHESAEQVRQFLKLLEIESDEFKQIYHSRVQHFIPHEHADASFDGNPFTFMNGAFIDSYVNIITEHWHHTQKPFISEKTLKPILSGQLFAHTGSVGTIELLSTLNLDTFSDVINHNVYAHEHDLFAKMDKLYQYLQSMIELDWIDIYNQTQQRRLHNRNQLLNGQIKTKFVHNLKEKLDEIL